MRRAPLGGLAALGLGTVSLAAVGLGVARREPPPPPGAAPPDLRYGVDPCDGCLMIVNEARFAAAYETRAREVRRFDDIGDMLAFHRARGEAVAAFWVHDYADGAWVPAAAAAFVHAPEVITPMGSGLLAFRDPARAAAFAREHQGVVRDLRALLRAPLGRPDRGDPGAPDGAGKSAAPTRRRG